MFLVCQVAFASPEGDYVQWATGGGYAAEYWGTFESDFYGYQQLGATMSAGTVYEIRPVFKFDISGLDVGDLVEGGKITFLDEGGVLAESDDVMIESFQSTEIAASFSDFFSAPATASQVAFAANEAGVYDGSRYYLIAVDINDWLQSAVDNGEDVFSVRLSTPYLQEAGAMDGKPLPYVRYLGPVGTGLKPGVLAYSVDVPEPATISLLAGGMIFGLVRRKK